MNASATNVATFALPPMRLTSWRTGKALYEAPARDVRRLVEEAVAVGADLTGADLHGADLTGANLARANLTGANLAGANLAGADLTGAYITCANLAGANLTGATMPDGRPWELYRADPIAGICDTPEARARAVAAWGAHTWRDCPMAAGLGVHSLGEVAEERRRDVAAFVALFDARLLPEPSTI